MKLTSYLPLIIVSSILFSCKKEDTAVTRPVVFTSTSYDSLGSYDAGGRPNYLVTGDVVSTSLLSFIQTTLPNEVDLRKSNPELLTTKAIADIAITASADVFITFVSQGAGYTNTFAFYTYPTNQQPKTTADIPKITYIFPNSGNQTPLQQGDKVKLGRFNAGTSIGFVLLPQGWSNISRIINNKAVHFCSNDILNPEVDPNLKKHAVLINYTPENKVLIGFEDVDRTTALCDHDFNDVVFYCTVTP